MSYNREIEISLNGRLVEYLFDVNGEETFDLSVAAEAAFDGGELVSIQEGDVIAMTVYV